MNPLQPILESTGWVLPEILIVLGLIVLVLVVSFQKQYSQMVFYISIIINVSYLIITSTYYQNAWPKNQDLVLFDGMLVITQSVVFFKQLVHVSLLVFLIHSRLFKYKFDGEIYILILAVCLGLDIMIMSRHLLLIYLGLEMVSILSYVLVASNKSKLNFEAAFKYLILGSSSSAIMLLGVSYIYGISYTLDISDPVMTESLLRQPGSLSQILVFLIIGAFLFKVAAVPFHSWVPDVYETTSTPILSFLSYAPKLAGFVVIGHVIKNIGIDLDWVLGIIAVLSMMVGNLAALQQKNLKRMLGFSGVAHVGFILTGFLLFNENQLYGTFFYLVVYLPVTMGSFYIVDVLYKYRNSYVIEDFKGLGQQHIGLGIHVLIIMATLVGLPPTVGFIAKLMVFGGLFQADTHLAFYYSILIFGFINTAISIYYYLKVPYYMLVKGTFQTESRVSGLFWIHAVLSYFSLILVFLFFFPDQISQIIKSLIK